MTEEHDTTKKHDAPSEPIFELEPNDLPEELLTPLRSWFEAAFAFDYEHLAEIYMELASDESNVSLLQQGAMGHHPGEFRYARSVVEWSVDGSSANVKIRGVEYICSEFEEEPVSREVIWEFYMLQSGLDWKMAGYGTMPQSHEDYPALPESEKPWLKRWRSGKVE
jgi:hypothetical protein